MIELLKTKTATARESLKSLGAKSLLIGGMLAPQIQGVQAQVDTTVAIGKEQMTESVLDENFHDENFYRALNKLTRMMNSVDEMIAAMDSYKNHYLGMIVEAQRLLESNDRKHPEFKKSKRNTLEKLNQAKVNFVFKHIQFRKFYNEFFETYYRTLNLDGDFSETLEKIKKQVDSFPNFTELKKKYEEFNTTANNIHPIQKKLVNKLSK